MEDTAVASAVLSLIGLLCVAAIIYLAARRLRLQFSITLVFVGLGLGELIRRVDATSILVFRITAGMMGLAGGAALLGGSLAFLLVGIAIDLSRLAGLLVPIGWAVVISMLARALSIFGPSTRATAA